VQGAAGNYLTFRHRLILTFYFSAADGRISTLIIINNAPVP
jgi:hypothetical protein